MLMATVLPTLQTGPLQQSIHRKCQLPREQTFATSCPGDLQHQKMACVKQLLLQLALLQMHGQTSPQPPQPRSLPLPEPPELSASPASLLAAFASGTHPPSVALPPLEQVFAAALHQLLYAYVPRAPQLLCASFPLPLDVAWPLPLQPASAALPSSATPLLPSELVLLVAPSSDEPLPEPRLCDEHFPQPLDGPSPLPGPFAALQALLQTEVLLLC
mmetsp:Transcript_10196/g.18196  ORF Transcript_10196/g.18196 Transcript_10196/m.18196 type:complete len:216 (-) Transcript_10196:408-1055(-)